MSREAPIRVIQCAEAIVEVYERYVKKVRIPKTYRVKELDDQIRNQRTKTEAKTITEARKGGVPTPIIYDISGFEITMERIEGEDLKVVLNEEICKSAGEMIGKLHNCGIVHCDLTTSNMIYTGDKIYLIDFGLSYFDQSLEARGVDIHLFFQTLKSTHDKPDELREAFEAGYRSMFSKADEVLGRVQEIEKRGRYL
ncbi:MAG: Kae1-associated kinase Bud32 [Halobacteriota archaeon]|nr:Kae1-associated kinase Bud32 [Halobacteriota archaeon]